jgi:hypothetical protein
VSSDSIVKGIIDDIIKTAEVDEQKTKRKHEKVISQLYKVNTEQNIYILSNGFPHLFYGTFLLKMTEASPQIYKMFHL